MKYIPRDLYSKRITPFIDKPIIKVLTGQRRVGKSYVLYQLMDEIRGLHENVNIVYINKELEEFFPIQTHTDLLDYLKDKLAKENNYLFIDEVQEIGSFQLALRTLLASDSCDIYCTGSNANMLSGELATLLSGRYISFTIHSLSYQEFLLFHQLDNQFDHLLKFLQFG
ncbi:MAG TPA: AAA family ATPase, partial [Puia sp.]